MPDLRGELLPSTSQHAYDGRPHRLPIPPIMKLYIGNKNYSSWSMRPWVLLTDAGIPFDEVKVRFDAFTPGSDFKRTMAALAPTAKVPVLVDGDLVVWDTLAIAEYLAEWRAEHQPAQTPLWPAGPAQRARARSLCAEMHCGFGALRSHCPMNIEADLPEVGARVLAEQSAVRADLDRLSAMWTQALADSGGPWLFGADFTVADAYFAPVVMRLRSYQLPLPAEVLAYVERVLARPSVAAWIADALVERDFLEFEEPYRSAPGARTA
jgi:glutathione S-transferase